MLEKKGKCFLTQHITHVTHCHKITLCQELCKIRSRLDIHVANETITNKLTKMTAK